MPGLVIAPVGGAGTTTVAPTAGVPQVHDVVRHRMEPVAGIGDDPFHDPLLGWIGLVVAIVVILNLAVGGILYWGVQYRVPPWNAHSVPPPIVY
jgi:hypothetical protein